MKSEEDGSSHPVARLDVAFPLTLRITADGSKRVLGLRQGATENATVCVALLEDLQARGPNTSQSLLLVLDGAKVLHMAAKRVWGRNGMTEC